MEFKLRSALLLMLFGLFVVSCDNDDDTTDATEEPTTEEAKSNLTLDISGLEDLGDDYVYEGWIIVDGAPVSTGTFTVNADKALSATTFELDKAQLESATKYVLTIEPTVDPDPAPSKAKILAGSFDGTDASLSVGDDSALGVDLTTATGNYILATPTDSDSTNENSGVWWLTLPEGDNGMTKGLDLPTLPEGWAYEGWAVIDETPVSTGTFTDASMADDAAPFSGTVSTGPNYPGEDFLMNAPEGLTFPTDLAGKTVVISIEPVPDNSAAPFLLKPLVAPVADDATDHTQYTMNNNAAATNPTGTAKR